MWAFITTIRCLIKCFMLGIYADSYFVLIQNNNHHNNTNNNNYNININVNTDVSLKKLNAGLCSPSSLSLHNADLAVHSNAFLINLQMEALNRQSEAFQMQSGIAYITLLRMRMQSS